VLDPSVRIGAFCESDFEAVVRASAEVALLVEAAQNRKAIQSRSWMPSGSTSTATISSPKHLWCATCTAWTSWKKPLKYASCGCFTLVAVERRTLGRSSRCPTSISIFGQATRWSGYARIDEIGGVVRAVVWHSLAHAAAVVGRCAQAIQHGLAMATGNGNYT